MYNNIRISLVTLAYKEVKILGGPRLLLASVLPKIIAIRVGLFSVIYSREDKIVT